MSFHAEWSSSFIATVYAGVFIVSVLLFYCMFSTKSSDPYGLFHLSLNKLPNGDPDQPPNTEWLNMGYWQTARSFPDACEALAIKLIQHSRYKNGNRVLDVGYGTGESLILLLTHPSIPRPSSLTGITSIPLHHERSMQRVNSLEPSITEGISISLHDGDAVFRPRAVDHPLDPSSSEPKFDAILALDCAYHFRTREDFLRQCFSRLAPSGHVALADICFDSDMSNSSKARLVRRVLKLMPRENAITTKQYIDIMKNMGYVEIELQDISKDVFPGFVKFLKTKGWGWWLFAIMLNAYYSAGARFILVSGKKI